MDDIDIFGYFGGGSVSEMMNPVERELPSLSPAQIANVGAAFADPLGMVDITGEYPEFPAAGVSVSEMVMEGPRSPSLIENLREGNYGAAALQGIGVIPVVGGAARAARNLIKGADRLEKAKKAGFDTETVYYHGTDSDITEFRMPSRETGQTKTVGTGVFMSSSPEVAGSYAKENRAAGKSPSIYPVYINKQEFLRVRPADKGQMWSNISTDGLVVEFPDGTTKPANEVFKLEEGSTNTDELSRIAKSQGRKGLIIEGVVDAGTGTSGEYRYATQYLRDKGYDVSLPIGTTKESFDKMQAVPSEIMEEARLYAKAQLYRPADVVVSFDPKNIRSVNAKFEDLDTADISKAKGGAIDINDIDIFESPQSFVGGGGVIKKISQAGKTDGQKGIGSLPVGDEAVKGKDLQFLMNIRPDALQKQQELGSFPMPSIAVVKQDQPFESFGSITLVGDPTSFDPKRLKANVVFNADAYTIRAPRPFRLARKDADLDFKERFATVGKEFEERSVDDLVYNLSELETKKRATAREFGDLERFLDSDIVADIVFLREKGVTEIPIETGKYAKKAIFVDRDAVRKMIEPLSKERKAWAKNELNRFFQEEEFFDASVNRDYVTGKGLIVKPYTVEEVLKFMKKRKGSAKEEGMLTPGSLRASLTEKLKSLEEIRARSGKLVGNEEMVKFQNASYSKIHDLSDALKPYYKFKADRFGFSDEVLGLLMDSETIGLERALTRYGFEDLPEDVVQQIQRTKSYFKNAPTEYFEAKPERLVDIEEFQGAIVPEGTSEDVVQSLKDSGIQVETYGDQEQRVAARKKFAGTAFSVAGGITLVGYSQDSEAGGLSSFGKMNKLVKEQSLKQAKEQGYNLDNVMYHASKQDIDEFVPGYDDGLVFLTPNKEFANNWLGKGRFKERQDGTGAIEGVRAERKRFMEEQNKIMESMPEDQRQQYYEEVVWPQRRRLITEEQEADSAIYPVVTKTKKPFVPSKDVDVLEELYGKEYLEAPFGSGFATFRDAMKDGNYLLYENKQVVDFLKSKGYDSMFLKESSGADQPFTTLAVFEPSDIRSVNAKFDPKEKGSPKILASVPFAAGIGALGSMQEARADALAAEGAGTEVILDALSGIASPIAGGVAGLLEYLSPVDRFKEGKGQRIREAREGVADALDYEPRSELAKEMKQQALQGISTAVRPVVETVAPIARDFKDYITDPENVMDDYGLNLLPSAYQAGSYLYENIFGEPEREATKSAMDVVL